MLKVRKSEKPNAIVLILSIILDVSTEDFANIEEAKGERSAPRLKNFSPAQRLLILVVPTLRYERSHSKLYDLIMGEVAAMGV